MTISPTIAVIGLGTHGREITRLLAEAGFSDVTGIDPHLRGSDLGELSGVPALAGCAVLGDLGQADPVELVIVAARLPTPADVAALVERALAHGANVITIVEELFDLASSDPALHARLDEAARRAGRTVLATGVQDAAWLGLSLLASAGVRGLRAIHLRQHLGIDGYPRPFVDSVGIGADAGAFAREADKARETPSVFGGILPALARKLGLEVAAQSRDLQPVTRDAAVASRTLGRELAPGESIGRLDRVTLHTAEGITLSAELSTTAVMGEDEFSLLVDAVPQFELRHRFVTGGSATVNAIVVNRIPDVLAAPAGLISAADLPLPHYRKTLDAAGARPVLPQPATLYYSPGSCALAPHIVATQAGIALRLVRVDLDSRRTENGDDYLAVNPNGYVPALVLDNGEVLAEAAALVQYLADLRPEAGLIPPVGTLERQRVVQALSFTATELHKGMDAFWRPGLSDEARAAHHDHLRRRLAHVDTRLQGRDFFVTEYFGVADAYLWVVLRSMPGVGVDPRAFGNIGRYLDRIAALPAVRQSLREQGEAAG